MICRKPTDIFTLCHTELPDLHTNTIQGEMLSQLLCARAHIKTDFLTAEKIDKVALLVTDPFHGNLIQLKSLIKEIRKTAP